MEEQDNRLTVIASIIHLAMSRGAFGFDDISKLKEAEDSLNSIAYDVSILFPQSKIRVQELEAEVNKLNSQISSSVIVDGELHQGEDIKPLVVGNQEEPVLQKKRSK